MRHYARVGVLFVLLFCWLSPAPAKAHLMVGQHGTLNFVKDGAFLVLSVPVTALRGVDDDGDGRLSAAEIQKHGAAIQDQIRAGIQLHDAAGPRPLQGLLVNNSPEHEHRGQPAEQLVAMGRFSLGSAVDPLHVKTTLFGSGPGEQALHMRMRRGAATEELTLTPTAAEAAVFPTPKAPASGNPLLSILAAGLGVALLIRWDRGRRAAARLEPC